MPPFLRRRSGGSCRPLSDDPSRGAGAESDRVGRRCVPGRPGARVRRGRDRSSRSHLSADRLAQLLAAAPENPEHPGQRRLRSADFAGATFGGDADFAGATFGGDARFEEATSAGTPASPGRPSAGTPASPGRPSAGTPASPGRPSAGTPASPGRPSAGTPASPGRPSAGTPASPGPPSGGDAHFEEATFSGTADFDRATFSGDAFFGATFSGHARFFGATFGGDAHFDGATFSGHAHFDGATFSGHADFARAPFSGHARFGRAQFVEASFDGATFSGHADFARATFGGDARFDGATFGGDARFGGTTFGGDARFAGTTFERRVTIGPLVVAGVLVFDDAEFHQDVELNASTGELRCRRTRFGGLADLNVRWAEIALDNATFAARSRLAGAAEFAGNLDETSAQSCRVDRRLDADVRPRLVSLRYANVENLALGNVDLLGCRFFGAHGLDQLRIEADCEFPQPPAKRRYTRRRALAEEHHWQAERAASASAPGSAQASGWYPGACQPPGWLEPAAEVLDRARIAGLYRALRKALEDRNDAPGAADFYYGEMQMRRYAARPPGRERDHSEPRADPAAEPYHPIARGERWLLTLYWLTSGYALRASRAFASLVLVILVFALGFWAVGFPSRACRHACAPSARVARSSTSAPYRRNSRRRPSCSTPRSTAPARQPA